MMRRNVRWLSKESLSLQADGLEKVGMVKGGDSRGEAGWAIIREGLAGELGEAGERLLRGGYVDFVAQKAQPRIRL
jgi:hypothetical protein